MAEFAGQFSVLGDTNFAEYIRSGEFVRLSELLCTFQVMNSRKVPKAPR